MAGWNICNSTALICGRVTCRARARRGPVRATPRCWASSATNTFTLERQAPAPAEFARYDYAQENYTELLWFFEGFTSYYDDLLLRAPGCWTTPPTKLRHQNHQPGAANTRPVGTNRGPGQFDAWVKYYRQDENTPNTTVSYYTKGSLVGLCLDLALRREGKATLDDVMRALWKRCAGGPMTETDLRAVLHDLGRAAIRQRTGALGA